MSPPSSESFDVLVIGAGPAGSTLALRLARSGFRIALLDRKRFPRPKPCGEFLSPECLALLDDLGLRQRIEDRGGHRVTGMRIHGYQHRTKGLFRDIGHSALPHLGGHAVRREVLDLELVEAAAARPEVTFFEGWSCRSLLHDPRGRVVGVRARSLDGGSRELRARWTAGADGVRSAVAGELGVLRRIDWLDKIALTTHYTGVAVEDTAEVHVFPGGYFAAAPVDGGRFSLNLILDRVALRQRRGGWDDFFATHLARVPELAERMRTARRIAAVRGTGPLAYRTTAQAAAGAVLVGDACGYVDPITGEGIYFALRGADLLAATLDRALHRGDTSRHAMRPYLRARRREIAPRIWLATQLQRGLRHTTLARRVLAALEHRPGLADLLVSFAGDYVRLRELLRPGVWWQACSTAAPR